MPPLIGSVVERKITNTSTDTGVGTNKDPTAPLLATPRAPGLSRFAAHPRTGFPLAQHRSWSQFGRARAREAGAATTRANDEVRLREVPVVASAVHPTIATTTTTISEQNAGRIAGMTGEEVEEVKREIMEQLGSNVGALVDRVREARKRRMEQTEEAQTERKADEQRQLGEGVETRVEARKEEREEASRETDASRSTTGSAIAQPKPITPGLAARPGVLRVKSLENVSRSAPSPILLKPSSTRPSSRTGRRLRFAEVTPRDVHVYESAPSSPKRRIFALPPPPDKPDPSVISLRSPISNAVTLPAKRTHPQPDEGDTGSVPAATVDDDDDKQEPGPDCTAPSEPPGLRDLRFNLFGSLISPARSVALSSSPGLHHAEGHQAGYSLDDIFLLARSVVPAQRAAMLGLLAKITPRLARQVRYPAISCAALSTSLAGKEEELRARILAAGLAALGERGSTGVMAVQVVWACLFAWDSNIGAEAYETDDNLDIELNLAPALVASIQPAHLLPLLADLISQATLPQKSLGQLLDIVYRLASESNALAEQIVATPRLVPAILSTFVLTSTSLPANEDTNTDADGITPLQAPNAVRLLTVLASASRSNARMLCDPADTLLRFVALLPGKSSLPVSLAAVLLRETLYFYAVLARYGMYAHIAGTAAQPLTALGSYLLALPSPESTSMLLGSRVLTSLRAAWAALIEAWTVCATDPHATTPPHDVVWSQLGACGWLDDVRTLCTRLTEAPEDWAVWSAAWHAQAAWLEGARVNGTKGGEEERAEVLPLLQPGFRDGLEGRVVCATLRATQQCLGDLRVNGSKADSRSTLRAIVTSSQVLAAAVRLWLACLPSRADERALESPPFQLPFSELSSMCARLVRHGLWASSLGSRTHVHLRTLTDVLVNFHRLSWYIPGTPADLWLAQGLAVLPRLVPGDEAAALDVARACLARVTPEFCGLSHAKLCPGAVKTDALWPFLERAIRPTEEVYVGPLHTSPESISRCTTLRLVQVQTGTTTTTTTNAGLPLARDWLTAPLTQLLRGESSAAPYEVVVRATLLMLYAARGVLLRWGLDGDALSPAEVVLACMRVCVLERAGESGGGLDVDVFRDDVVEVLMSGLLDPFMPKPFSSAPAPAPAPAFSPLPLPSPSTLHDTPSSAGAPLPELTSQSSLECAFERGHGHGHRTPFYQFYTDLVAQYAGVSFAHPIFGALLLPPLAMRYAGDYRRLLWLEDGGDESAGVGAGVGAAGGAGVSEVVRTVRVGVERVICTGLGWEEWDGAYPLSRKDDAEDNTPPETGAGADVPVAARTRADLREYLYPPERDPALLGAYTRAILAGAGAGGGRDAPGGFLRLIAVHHVACALWADMARLAGVDADVGASTGRRLLLVLVSALVARGSDDVKTDGRGVRDVFLYRQSSRGPFSWPPDCFEGGAVADGTGANDWRTERIEYARQILGEEMAEQVKDILEQTRERR